MHALIKEALTDVHKQQPQANLKISAIPLSPTQTQIEVKHRRKHQPFRDEEKRGWIKEKKQKGEEA